MPSVLRIALVRACHRREAVHKGAGKDPAHRHEAGDPDEDEDAVETPEFARIGGSQFCGPNSVAAVRSMQATMTMKSGFRQAANIEPVETPCCTRSVLGMDCGKNIAP